MSLEKQKQLIPQAFLSDPDRYYDCPPYGDFNHADRDDYFYFYNRQVEKRTELPNYEILQWVGGMKTKFRPQNNWIVFAYASTHVMACDIADLFFEKSPCLPVLILQVNDFYDLETYNPIDPDYHHFFGNHKIVEIKGELPQESCWTTVLREKYQQQQSNLGN